MVLLLIMSCLVSGISTFSHMGPAAGFVSSWMHSWALSWVIAYSVLLIILPLVRRIAAWIVEPAP